MYGQCWTSKGYKGYDFAAMPTLPKIATEYGFSDTSPTTNGKYIVNSMLDAFWFNWFFIDVYCLYNQDGVSANYALFNDDKSPKASATIIHNFTTILADADSSFTPGALNYSVTALGTAHNLLLQKSTGRFDVAVWNERPPSTLTFNVTVNLGGPHTNVKVFDPTVGTAPVQTLGKVSSVPLVLTDHAFIVECDCNFDPAFPYCSMNGGVYLDSVTVTFSTDTNAVIHYTTDGSLPQLIPRSTAGQLPSETTARSMP